MTDDGSALYCLDCGVRLGTYYEDMLLDAAKQTHTLDTEHHRARPRFETVVPRKGRELSATMVASYRIGDRVRLADGWSWQPPFRHISGFAIHGDSGIIALFREGGSLSIERLTPAQRGEP